MWVWLVWVLAFCVIEGRALWLRRTADTFSWQVWALERRLPVCTWLIVAFLAWLAGHFALHWA